MFQKLVCTGYDSILYFDIIFCFEILCFAILCFVPIKNITSNIIKRIDVSWIINLI